MKPRATEVLDEYVRNYKCKYGTDPSIIPYDEEEWADRMSEAFEMAALGKATITVGEKTEPHAAKGSRHRGIPLICCKSAKARRATALL